MKVLLIRFSSIGDIVLTSPVLRCLKTQLPGLSLHVLTKASFRAIYENNPAVDKVYTFSDTLGSVIPDLKQEEYDHIVDLHRNLRSILVWMRLRRPRTTFPKLNLQKWLLVNLHLNRMPAIHIVDRYFRAVERLGVMNDGGGLDYFITPEDEMDLNDFPSAYLDGFIAMAIGGKHKTKILPAHKAAEVIERLNFPVILLGGKEDRQRGDEILARCSSSVYNACGELSLGQSASVLRQARAVITNDTGLMHIAAAFRKRIISVWGNTVPELGMSPYLPEGEGASVISEVSGLKCRPCSKIGYTSCPKKHFRCMEDQDTARIAAEAMNL